MLPVSFESSAGVKGHDAGCVERHVDGVGRAGGHLERGALIGRELVTLRVSAAVEHAVVRREVAVYVRGVSKNRNRQNVVPELALQFELPGVRLAFSVVVTPPVMTIATDSVALET